MFVVSMASETLVTTETNKVSVEGYKIFQSDWSCLGYSYQVGKTNEFEGEIQMEKAGLHFCPRALDCIRYYKLDYHFKYAKVRGSNQVITVGDKCVTNRLEILEEITYPQFMKLCTGTVITKLSKTTYKEGLKCGEYTEWFPSTDGKQQLKIRSQYENNQLHGLTEEWDRKGRKTHYSLYVRGRLIRKYTIYVDGTMNWKNYVSRRDGLREVSWYPRPLETETDFIAYSKHLITVYSK